MVRLITQMKKAVTIVAAFVLIAVLSSCSAGSADNQNQSASQADQLRLAFTGPPISLNPVKAGTGSSTVFLSLAYDPLIFMTPEGELVPSLAKSWKFIDDKNKVFELKLRKGVNFSGGAAVDAEAVKASMEYFLQAGGKDNATIGNVASIEAVDSTTVRIHYAEPFPNAANSLSQYFMFGNIIGPDGLANPKSLLKSMHGAGPYLYKPGKSVTNSKYVYERNPDYWNPDAQLYESVSIKIIADPNATLSALKTGQVDEAGGSLSTVVAAEAASLKVVSAPFYNWSIYLADTEGVVNPALKSQKVRKAIALSIGRESITKAVAGEYGSPSGQPMNKGTKGYVDGAGFTQDLGKAKQLLAEAGYADGFDLRILTTSGLDKNSLLSQAVADDIEKLGIDVHLKVVPTVPDFVRKAESKKYGAIIFPLTGNNMGVVYNSLQSGLRNPFGYRDSKLENLYAKSLVANDQDRLSIYQQMTKRMLERAVVVPVMTEDNLTYVGPGITNVKASALNPNPLPTGPKKKYEWQPVK